MSEYRTFLSKVGEILRSNNRKEKNILKFVSSNGLWAGNLEESLQRLNNYITPSYADLLKQANLNKQRRQQSSQVVANADYERALKQANLNKQGRVKSIQAVANADYERALKQANLNKQGREKSIRAVTSADRKKALNQYLTYTDDYDVPEIYSPPSVPPPPFPPPPFPPVPPPPFPPPPPPPLLRGLINDVEDVDAEDVDIEDNLSYPDFVKQYQKNNNISSYMEAVSKVSKAKAWNKYKSIQPIKPKTKRKSKKEKCECPFGSYNKCKGDRPRPDNYMFKKTEDGEQYDLGKTIINVYCGATNSSYVPQEVAQRALEVNNASPQIKQQVAQELGETIKKIDTQTPSKKWEPVQIVAKKTKADLTPEQKEELRILADKQAQADLKKAKDKTGNLISPPSKVIISDDVKNALMGLLGSRLASMPPPEPKGSGYYRKKRKTRKTKK